MTTNKIARVFYPQEDEITIKASGHYIENLSSDITSIYSWEYHLDIVNQRSDTLILVSLRLFFTDEFGLTRDLNELIELNDENPVELYPRSEYKRVGIIILQSKFSIIQGEVSLYSLGSQKMLNPMSFEIILNDPLMNVAKA